MIETDTYYAKLANNQALSSEEAVMLLKELKHFRDLAAYLASCQAATLESLPKSASKSSRVRHQSICQVAVKALSGDISAIKYPVNVETAVERCKSAASTSSNQEF